MDCPHPTCSGHGFCADGTCLCKKGWKGPDCSETDNEALQCLPDCSGHGAFDLETQTCQCEPMWSGDDCSRGERRKHFIGTEAAAVVSSSLDGSGMQYAKMSNPTIFIIDKNFFKISDLCLKCLFTLYGTIVLLRLSSVLQMTSVKRSITEWLLF